MSNLFENLQMLNENKIAIVQCPNCDEKISINRCNSFKDIEKFGDVQKYVCHQCGGIFDMSEVSDTFGPQLYGVDVRDMHTGIHNIVVFDSEEKAIENEQLLNDLGNVTDEVEYELIMNTIMNNCLDTIDEIDYHDIEDTDNGRFYNHVKLVNMMSIDVFL